MTKIHNYYLNLAFQLAEKNLGHTGLNPCVGSVVVKNGSVISSGVTSINGRPHSESNALKKIKNCSGATLYTTLEPCTHQGKTPPCVNIIAKKKIKKVFYAFEDHDIRNYKKAKKFLNSKGIQTKLIHIKRYSKFYESYFYNKKFSVPFITGKIAISKDSFTIDKQNKWITNKVSRKIVHLIRNKYDCIISTSKSINYDNSLLNCRINGLQNNKPDLIIIDLNLRIKKKLLLNKLLKKRKTYLITYKNNSIKSMIYKKIGFKIILVNQLKSKKDFNLLFKKIYKIGYSRVLIETGLTFLNNLLTQKIINKLYIFKSNKNLGKNGKNNATNKYIKRISPILLTKNLNGDRLFKKDF